MKILFNKKFLQHNPDSYAEGNYRIADFTDIEDTKAHGEEFLTLVHNPDYIESVRDKCNNNSYLAEVQLSPESWEAAMTAVGLTIMASEQDDFAVVRPPGHHAYPGHAEGFCFFNNVAIAAQRMVNKGKKVFIFDFDGHHGNGVQHIFYKTDQVLYASIHQSFTYPMSGYPGEDGEDKGKGYTLNHPMMLNSGDREFMAAFDKILKEATNFKPDIVGVSAGFDGYINDRLLNLNYSLKLFYEIGFKLRRNFNHIFAVLEGGYHEDMRKCIDNFIEGVNKGAVPPKMKWDDNMAIG